MLHTREYGLDRKIEAATPREADTQNKHRGGRLCQPEPTLPSSKPHTTPPSAYGVVRYSAWRGANRRQIVSGRQICRQVYACERRVLNIPRWSQGGMFRVHPERAWGKRYGVYGAVTAPAACVRVRVRARAMATNDGPRDLFSTAHTQQSAAVMVSPLFAVQRFGAAVCANHNCTDVYKRISTLTTLRHRGFGGDAAQQEEKEGKRGR